jgi:hypothetical protein
VTEDALKKDGKGDVREDFKCCRSHRDKDEKNFGQKSLNLLVKEKSSEGEPSESSAAWKIVEGSYSSKGVTVRVGVSSVVSSSDREPKT